MRPRAHRIYISFSDEAKSSGSELGFFDGYIINGFFNCSCSCPVQSIYSHIDISLRPVDGLHEWHEHLLLDNGTKLRPQKIYQYPQGRGGYLLVLCDATDKSGNPIPTNNRDAAIKILVQPRVAAAVIRFDIRQRYIFLRPGCSGDKGPRTWDFKIAIPDINVVERVRKDILECCVRAGIRLVCRSESGISVTANAGVYLNDMQDGSSVADEVWALRYIVEKVATDHGLEAFDPNMIPGYDTEAGIRMKFSTQPMRNIASGYEAAKLAVHKLQMRDALSGEGNSEYKILKKQSGYVIEVKMPLSHDMDPHKITSWIAETVLLWKPIVRQILVAACAGSTLTMLKGIGNRSLPS